MNKLRISLVFTCLSHLAFAGATKDDILSILDPLFATGSAQYVTNATPISPTATATPLEVSDTIKTTQGQIATADFLQLQLAGQDSLTKKVNCVYRQLLPPTAPTSLNGFVSINKTFKQAFITATCGLSPMSDLIDEDVVKAMTATRQALYYKLIIEKCSRDILAQCEKSSDDTGDQKDATKPNIDTSNMAGGQCKGITKDRSSIDEVITPCNPLVLSKQWEVMRQVASQSYSCLKTSSQAPDDCEGPICQNCSITLDETKVPEQYPKDDTCQSLVDDYGGILKAANSIIADNRDYLGALFAQKIATNSSASTLPELLSYDDISGTSNCGQDNDNAPFQTMIKSANKELVVKKLLPSLAKIGGSSSPNSSGGLVDSAIPLPYNIILGGLDGMTYVNLQNNAQKKASFTKDAQKNAIAIMSYRKDKLKSINRSIRNNSSTSSSAHTMTQTALANIQWLLNQRLQRIGGDAKNGQCTAQGIQRLAVERRNTPVWSTQMDKSAYPIDLLREMTFLLADIHRQLFYNHQMQERMLVAMSMNQLYNASQMSSSGNNPLNSNKDDIIAYTKGSKCGPNTKSSDDSSTTDSSQSSDDPSHVDTDQYDTGGDTSMIK